jgi:hypothetical protein
MIIFYCLQDGMICASSYLVTPKNKYKKSIDSVTLFCDSVRVLAADVLRMGFCGLIHKLIFE